jgi:hypothetical protein
MKLIDAICNVERPASQTSWDFRAPSDAINESLGLPYVDYYSDALMERLKAYPILEWICTDTWVGLYALYLDDEAVGAAYQSARRNSFEIEWVSQSAAQRVQQTILQYTERSNEFDLIDPEQDIGEDFSRPFVTQLLTDDGFFEGRHVRVLVKYDWLGHCTPKEYRTAERSYTISVHSKDEKRDHLLVQDGDEQRLIHVEDFKMKFNVKDATDEINHP